MTGTYPADLTAIQKILVKANLDKNIPGLRKYDFFEVLDAIAYVVKTGIQWPMLPRSFPPYQGVYHHFRSWSPRGWSVSFLKVFWNFGFQTPGGQVGSGAYLFMDGESPKADPKLRTVSEDCPGHVHRHLCLLYDKIFPLTLQFSGEAPEAETSRSNLFVSLWSEICKFELKLLLPGGFSVIFAKSLRS